MVNNENLQRPLELDLSDIRRVKLEKPIEVASVPSNLQPDQMYWIAGELYIVDKSRNLRKILTELYNGE